MWRELTGSFTRGARLGLLVAASTLVLAVTGGLLAISASPKAAAAIDTMDPWHHAAVSSPEEPAPVERSPELGAARPPRETSTVLAGLEELIAEMVRRDLADRLDERVASAAAATEPAPPPPPPPPPRVVTIPDDELYARLADTFPEDADRAYRIVMCESSGNAASNTGNGYYGMWQFDLPTWQSVGGTGLPSDAPADEQIMRARMLYDLRGWAPWSGCVR